MKKAVKKLMLSRETLRSLADRELSAPNGGVTNTCLWTYDPENDFCVRLIGPNGPTYTC
jgi:hypothetical protein